MIGGCNTKYTDAKYIKFQRIMIFYAKILIILLFFLTLILLSIDGQIIKRKPVIIVSPSGFQSTRDFTIIIHSSNKTKWRLDKYLMKYIVNKPHIHIYIVYAEGVKPDPRFNSIIAIGSTDHRMCLDRRNVYAYNFFLKNKNLGDFLFRAMDDTYVNITNLEKLIKQLRLIYDPYKHIVYRGAINDENNEGKVFLGGGSGWLMSRAMVSLHQIPFYSFEVNIKTAWAIQDDTAETIIVRKIGFKSMKSWVDPRWAESGSTIGNLTEYLNYYFTRLEICSNENDLIPINEMISLHSVHDDQKEIWLKLFTFPSFIYCFKVKFSQCVRICKAVGPVYLRNRTSFKYLKDNADFISYDEIIEKNLSVWNKSINYLNREINYDQI